MEMIIKESNQQDGSGIDLGKDMTKRKVEKSKHAQ